VDYLADKGYDSKMGARPLNRKIDELIRVPLSRRILFESLRDCTVFADTVGDQIEFRVEANVVPTVNQEGIIVVTPGSDI
jgi:ATP-dependent Clp protease ATP-binding subunit ClpA